MNKFNILIAILVCLNICGCSDFLEEDPKGRLTTDNFYNSESDARQAILMVSIADYPTHG